MHVHLCVCVCVCVRVFVQNNFEWQVVFSSTLPEKYLTIPILNILYLVSQGFPCSSVGKESACSAGDRVRSLSWADPLEKEIATHSSILAWKISEQRSLGG